MAFHDTSIFFDYRKSKGVVQGRQATGNVNWAVPGSIRSWQKKVHPCPLSTSSRIPIGFLGMLAAAMTQAIQAKQSKHTQVTTKVTAQVS